MDLFAAIFRDAARVGARSIAIPAISAGKRGFPGTLASAITTAAAATEVIASGGTLDVYIVAYGDENHKAAFERATRRAVCEFIT